MRFLTKKSVVRKIIIVCVIVLLLNFSLTTHISYAAGLESIAGALATEIMKFVSWLGDIVMGALNNFMLGSNTGFGGFGSAMLKASGNDNLDPNINEDRNPDDRSWLYVPDGEKIDESIPGGALRKNWQVPNMLYSPENIFANNIAALDVNFLRQNTYKSVYIQGNDEFKDSAEKHAESTVSKLRPIISGWYKSFRNIAAVTLLSILIYLGIRILISSTSADKAKYKETLRDWFIALCLIFVIHFIMSGILTITDKFTELFTTDINKGITVEVTNPTLENGVSFGYGDNSEFKFRTNLMGLVRFKAQADDASESAAYTIIYVALVIYTCIFTFMYLKRVLYMAFFTMIAPLVAVTYPIDRAGDGKAQAFNLWFKEYTMNAIIQPVHLVLYSVFVTTAADLATNNPIYALVAIGFLIPAEKFIKKMFGLDRAESTGGFGSFAGGALAMSGLQKLAHLRSGNKDGKGSGSGGVNSANSEDNKQFSKRLENTKFSAFGADEDQQEGTQPSDPIKQEEDKEQDDQENDSESRREMLDADSENFGNAEGMDMQQYNALANEESGNDDGYKWTDEDYEQILRESNPDATDEEIEKLMAEQRAESQEYNGEQPKESIRTRVANNGKKVIKGVKRGAHNVYSSPIGGMAARAGSALWRNKGKIARGALKGAGMVAGGAIGLGAGLTTGDFSKTAQFASVGAIAGNAIGGNTARGVPTLVNKTRNTASSISNAWREETLGNEEAQRRQIEKHNEKVRKNLLKDRQEIANAKQIAGRIGYKIESDEDLKKLQNTILDYKEKGINNDELIEGALQAEKSRDGGIGGKSHEKLVQAAAFAHENKISASSIDDEKSRKAMENSIQYNPELKNNVNMQKEVAQMIADMVGRGEGYKNLGTIGKGKKK